MELRLIISRTSCNQSPMTILLWWLVFLTSVRPQAEVHLPRQNQPTAEIKTLKSLHSTAAPLIKCAECRVQFAKLQVFCTCKYSLITAIKEDYGRLADGECNVVLIRVWMHCNTNRMLTPLRTEWAVRPWQIVSWCSFLKAYNHLQLQCVRNRKKGRLGITKTENIMATRWKKWEAERSGMQRQWKTDVMFLGYAVLGVESWIRMTSKNILTTVNMALEAIKSDLGPEINHRKLETAHAPGYEEPRKLRLTKGLGGTSKLSQEKEWTMLTWS